jgi:hypothetical protein
MLPGLSPVCGKAIVARFDGASMSSDGGLLALREVEQRLGIASRLAACIDDPRDPSRVIHGLDAIIRTRMLMIASGYEDGNDADSLRADPMFKLAMGRLPGDTDLCSQPTISRLENLPDARTLLRMGGAAQGSDRVAGGMAAEGAPWSTSIAAASVRCRAASRSTSTTPSTPCMAASSCACSMPITTNTASSPSWCSTPRAA